jgi:hypothetical protein
VKNLSIQLGESASLIQEKFREKKIALTLNNFKQIIIDNSEIVFPEITKILNILFSYKNENFQEFTTEFVENNFTIPDLKAVVIEIMIKLNGIEGIIPFFQEFFQNF